jgi:Tol biopolymer transport system component
MKGATMKSILRLYLFILCLILIIIPAFGKAASTICGDADGNGKINLLDISYVINYLYRSGPPPNPMAAGDVNNSGKVNLLDISYTINYLYRSGRKPACSIYMGEIPPDSIPRIFAPGVVSISTSQEWGVTFDPELDSFYFSSLRNGSSPDIYRSQKVDGEWTVPIVAEFCTPLMEMEPYITPDGNTFYMSMERPGGDINVHYMTKTETGWSSPLVLEGAFAAIQVMYPGVSINNNMYFTNNVLSPQKICVSKYLEGNYQTPELLDNAINKGYYEAHPFIAPDESFIIFDAQNRPDTYGNTDLYISFRKSDDSWTESINLGSQINIGTINGCPYITPDGKYFFFYSDKSDNGDIYWCDTKFIDRLRQGILKIAFITYRYKIITNEICVMNADGTGFQRLTDDPANKDTPSFSPNGEEIAYSTEPDGSEDHQIFLIKSDGSRTRQITDGNGHSYCPDWSPDGAQIAFNRYNSSYTTSDIFIIDIGSGIEIQLTSNSGVNTMPDWFPGGDSLLFLSSRGGTYRLYIMNSDGTNQHAIGDPAMETTGGRVSPDGTKIAYDFVMSWNPVPYRNEIHLMNSDGTGDIALTAAGGINERGDWSPDGEQIVFHSDRSGIMKIYLMKADGSDVRLISTGNGDYCPTWGVVGGSAR